MNVNIKTVDVFDDDINSYARYYPNENTVVLNTSATRGLSEGDIAFIILHEIGHSKGNIKEIEADNYAIPVYLSMGYSLQDLANLFTDKFYNVDNSRIENVFKQLSIQDLKRNKNIKPLKNIKNMKFPKYIDKQDLAFQSAVNEYVGFDSTSGLGSALEEASGNGDKPKGKFDWNALGSFLGNLGGGLFGSMGNPVPVPVPVPEEKNKVNPLLIVGIVIVLVIIIFVVVKKKN